jgi:DNA-binding NtrC family response regulator
MADAIVTHEPPAAQTVASGNRQHVLVIDDEPSIRLALSRFFSRRGWTVDEAEDGAAGLDRLLAAGAPNYTMVVSDLKMPGLSGIELHDRLAASRPDILGRCVFSTGDAASSEVLSFIERSRCTVLQKPFELSTLDELVSRFIAERLEE